MVDPVAPNREDLFRIAGGNNRVAIALERLFDVAGSVTPDILDALTLASGGASALASAAREIAEDASQRAAFKFPELKHRGGDFDYVDFDPNGPHETMPNRMQWNNDDGTIDVGLNANVVLQVGQELHYYAKNTSGATISNGSPVVASGVVGASGKLTIAPAIGDGTYETRFFIGAATENIADNAFGYVSAFGLVRGFDTSAWSDGDLLYVSDTTAGAWTNVEPSAPNWRQPQAIVVNASAGGSGSIFVRRESEHALSELKDVYAPSPADGQILAWVAANNRWELVTPAAAPSGATGSFTAASGETVTVVNGLITSIV